MCLQRGANLACLIRRVRDDERVVAYSLAYRAFNLSRVCLTDNRADPIRVSFSRALVMDVLVCHARFPTKGGAHVPSLRALHAFRQGVGFTNDVIEIALSAARVMVLRVVVPYH